MEEIGNRDHGITGDHELGSGIDVRNTGRHQAHGVAEEGRPVELGRYRRDVVIRVAGGVEFERSALQGDSQSVDAHQFRGKTADLQRHVALVVGRH